MTDKQVEAEIALAEARKFYGPAGLRAVSEFIEERDQAREECKRTEMQLAEAKAHLTVAREECERLKAEQLDAVKVVVSTLSVSLSAFGGKSALECLRDEDFGVDGVTATLQRMYDSIPSEIERLKAERDGAIFKMKGALRECERVKVDRNAEFVEFENLHHQLAESQARHSALCDVRWLKGKPVWKRDINPGEPINICSICLFKLSILH